MPRPTSCVIRLMSFGIAVAAVLSSYPVWSHPGHDHYISNSIWPEHHPADSSAGYSSRTISLASAAVLDPRITAWKLADGSTGTSPAANINSVVSGILADINTVAYDNDHVYVRTSGVPSHSIGPFNNPNVPGDLDATYRVALNPTPETGARRSAAYSLGPMGIATNGAAFYGPWDGTYWNPNTNNLTAPGTPRPPGGADWNVNALWRRMNGMDDSRGHPSPVNGQTNPDGSNKGLYHYHMIPEGLADQVDPGNSGLTGSPILGFAFDGYAIVGPYAYDEQTQSVVQMSSSYGVNPNARGAGDPSVTNFALGSFIEDFAYIDGSGNLNEFNMAFVKFDEFERAVLTDETDPDGQWAYFATLDVIGGNSITRDGDVAYPYLVGPEFFGEVDAALIGGGPNRPPLIVPNDVQFYFSYAAIPEPSTFAFSCVLFGIAAGRRRRRSQHKDRN